MKLEVKKEKYYQHALYNPKGYKTCFKTCMTPNWRVYILKLDIDKVSNINRPITPIR